MCCQLEVAAEENADEDGSKHPLFRPPTVSPMPSTSLPQKICLLPTESKAGSMLHQYMRQEEANMQEATELQLGRQKSSQDCNGGAAI